MSAPNLHERMEAAEKARRAMIEKFRAKSESIDPEQQARLAEQAKARGEREARRADAEQRRRARVAAEKADRIAAAKAKAEAEAL
jgi:hypothetical protein